MKPGRAFKLVSPGFAKTPSSRTGIKETHGNQRDLDNQQIQKGEHRDDARADNAVTESFWEAHIASFAASTFLGLPKS
jgi:hypothetical protein